MKQKPAVKNELVLSDALFLNITEEDNTLYDVHADLRVAVQWDDMVIFTVHNADERMREMNIQVMLTYEQMESLITLYTEWKDDHAGGTEREGDYRLPADEAETREEGNSETVGQ